MYPSTTAQQGKAAHGNSSKSESRVKSLLIIPNKIHLIQPNIIKVFCYSLQALQSVQHMTITLFFHIGWSQVRYEKKTSNLLLQRIRLEHDHLIWLTRTAEASYKLWQDFKCFLQPTYRAQGCVPEVRKPHSKSH